MSTIVEEDELRMCRLLLSNTTVTIQNSKVNAEPFSTNIGSPQGDGISGTFFNVYFERSLRKLCDIMFQAKPALDHDYAMTSSMPDEMIYADDADFLTCDTNEKRKLNSIVSSTLAKDNLAVNDDKTEHVKIVRKKRGEEDWRLVKKLGSLIGDSEDVISRKQLAAAAHTSMEKIWIRKTKISVKKRIQLYNSLVKPVLTYNSGTWGLTKRETDSLDAFHRQQIRKVFKNSRMKNKTVYDISKSVPLSVDIAESRMRLFGHTLRMKIDTPAQKAMQFYFENNQNRKQFRGRPRTTIATVLNKNIKDAAAHQNQLCRDMPKSFESLADLYKIRQLASDKSAWKEFSAKIVEVAQVEESTPSRNTLQDDSA
jgi:hypothetical protein